MHWEVHALLGIVIFIRPNDLDDGVINKILKFADDTKLLVR